jgi:hypothetical protein
MTKNKVILVIEIVFIIMICTQTGQNVSKTHGKRYCILIHISGLRQQMAIMLLHMSLSRLL